MKLKYYMRGLGIGILVSTLILTISNPKEKLTDTEIKARAEGLGMVMKDEDSGSLDQLLASIKPTAAPTEMLAPTGTLDSSGTLAPTEVPSPEETGTPEATQSPEVTQAEPSATPDTADENAGEGEDSANVEITSGIGDEITFTVKEGMSSRQVSILLENNGIVEDAKDFNEYVAKLGKAEVVRTGTYILAKGATYDEIVDILTKSQE